MMKKYSKAKKLDFKACAEFVPKRITLDLLRIYYVKLHSSVFFLVYKNLVPDLYRGCIHHPGGCEGALSALYRPLSAPRGHGQCAGDLPMISYPCVH